MLFDALSVPPASPLNDKRRYCMGPLARIGQIDDESSNVGRTAGGTPVHRASSMV